MKCIVWFGLIVLFGAEVLAQHGGHAAGAIGGGMRGAAGRGGSGHSVFRGPIPRRFNAPFASPFVGSFYPYPLFDGDYDVGYPPPYQYQPSPNTIVVEPVQPVYVPQPAAVGNAVVHTYAGATGAADAQQLTFVLAMVDGSRIEATAVWAQQGLAHYIDPEDGAHQVPLETVDRALTRKLNQDRNLTLRLPAP